MAILKHCFLKRIVNGTLTFRLRRLRDHAARRIPVTTLKDHIWRKAMKKVLTAIALLGLAASAPALYAQAQNAASAELDAKQIIAKLESAGYTRIEDVEKDDGVWEVEATNSAGQRVELKVDPVTGAVLYEERDDWD